MTFGIAALGLNNSLPISTFSKALVFRGKATRVSGAGLSYYPADVAGIDTMVTTYFGGPNEGQFQVEEIAGIVGFVRGIGRTISIFGGGTQVREVFRASVTRDIGVFTYNVVCYGKPVLFVNSTSPSTKAGVLSVAQVGVVSGVPLWDIKLSVSFSLGTAESVFLSHITVYCFSATHSTDSVGGYGIQAFMEDGSLAYTSTSLTLVVVDYVSLTASTTPDNIADIIYTRNFSPEPMVSMFDIAKPGFMNIDFARYTWRQYATSFRHNSGGQDFYTWWWVDSKIINTGVSVANGELDFSLSVVDARATPQVFSRTSFSQPPYTQKIMAKSEVFPAIIPVIDCAMYD
jgi:hypothetical protein